MWRPAWRKRPHGLSGALPGAVLLGALPFARRVVTRRKAQRVPRPWHVNVMPSLILMFGRGLQKAKFLLLPYRSGCGRCVKYKNCCAEPCLSPVFGETLASARQRFCGHSHLLHFRHREQCSEFQGVNWLQNPYGRGEVGHEPLILEQDCFESSTDEEHLFGSFWLSCVGENKKQPQIFFNSMYSHV